MPSSMTHTYFGIDTYKKLNKNCQEKIKNKLEYFKLFCQGPDPFMFYHFFIGKKAKNIGKTQGLMHCTKTKDYFLKIIQYIHEKDLINNNEVMTYLYGYICHYYLDLYTHPFIYYKSGQFKKEDKNTYKYNGLHQAIEYAIDIYFIEKNEQINAKKFKIHNHIFNINKLTPSLQNIITTTIEEVYSIKNASTIYQKSIWYMKNFFKLANYDPYGFKLNIYKLLDKITPKNIIKVKELSYYNNYPNINNWLNLNNATWYCPWDKTKSYNNSFLDLYNQALNKSIKAIEEVTNMLENNKLDNKRLNELFQNLSYATGLNCKKEVELKYFEF